MQYFHKNAGILESQETNSGTDRFSRKVDFIEYLADIVALIQHYTIF